MKNQSLKIRKLNSALTFASARRVGLLALLLVTSFSISSQAAFAQSSLQSASMPSVQLEQVRWKSEDQVRSMLGDPKSVRGPIGTHASYQLWNYDGFSVAFANNRAFHLFDANSLRKFELEENR